MSGHYTPATAGRFFKKCQKFCQKMSKNRSWGILPKAKCCSVWVQQTFFLSEINFICINFIRLQGLAAGTVSGRNNGLPCCYVEFAVRAKTGFSYINFVYCLELNHKIWFANGKNKCALRMGCVLARCKKFKS